MSRLGEAAARPAWRKAADEAIEIATVNEGRAALTTAIINCCAFAVLTLSEYRPSGWFGG